MRNRTALFVPQTNVQPMNFKNSFKEKLLCAPLVPKMGLEPTRVSAKVFETSLSTIPTLRHMRQSRKLLFGNSGQLNLGINVNDIASTLSVKGIWYRQQDLNLHIFRYWFLRPACLPFHHTGIKRVGCSCHRAVLSYSVRPIRSRYTYRLQNSIHFLFQCQANGSSFPSTLLFVVASNRQENNSLWYTQRDSNPYLHLERVLT